MLSLSYSTHDLIQHLDGQPLQFMVKARAFATRALGGGRVVAAGANAELATALAAEQGQRR